VAAFEGHRDIAEYLIRAGQIFKAIYVLQWWLAGRTGGTCLFTSSDRGVRSSMCSQCVMDAAAAFLDEIYDAKTEAAEDGDLSLSRTVI